MFRFAQPRRIRRPGLTPMIDVVFLMLVFFMLAARFGQDAAVELSLAGGAGSYAGPPRLVDITPAELRLNGVAMAERELLDALARLTETAADPVVIRGRDGADLQRLVDVMTTLRAGGFTGLALAGN